MKQIIQSIITCLAVVLVSSCQSNKGQTLREKHEFLKGNLQLPRNLDYGGFYSFIDPPYYATFRSDHFVFMKHNDQGLLEEISIDDITASRNIIVYVDSSSNWSVLRDLLNSLDGRTFNRIHIAYDSDHDYGTSGGQTFAIQSSKTKASGNIFDLILFNDGSVLDLISETQYQTQDQLVREIGFNVDAILVKGHPETSAGELVGLFNTLAVTPRNGHNGCFLNIK